MAVSAGCRFTGQRPHTNQTISSTPFATVLASPKKTAPKSKNLYYTFVDTCARMCKELSLSLSLFSLINTYSSWPFQYVSVKYSIIMFMTRARTKVSTAPLPALSYYFYNTATNVGHFYLRVFRSIGQTFRPLAPFTSFVYTYDRNPGI